MNLADGLILLTVVVSALIGVWRGFVREAFSLATWVAAFLIAGLFSPGMDALLAPHLATPSLRAALAFGSLFVLTLFVGALLNRLLGELVRITGLTGTDRVLGGLFGLLRGVLLVIVLVGLGRNWFQHDPWWLHSALMPTLTTVQQWLWMVSGQTLGTVVTATGHS